MIDATANWSTSDWAAVISAAAAVIGLLITIVTLLKKNRQLHRQINANSMELDETRLELDRLLGRTEYSNPERAFALIGEDIGSGNTKSAVNRAERYLHLNARTTAEAARIYGQSVADSAEHEGEAALLEARRILTLGTCAQPNDTELRDQLTDVQNRIEGHEAGVPPQILSPDALEDAANKLFKEGKYEDALALQRQAADGMAAEHGPNSPQALKALNFVAALLRHLARVEEAEGIFLRIIDIARQNDTLRAEVLGNSLNSYGVLLSVAGRHAEREVVLKEALELSRKFNGLKSAAYATRLNNLASLLRETGRLEEAEPLFRQALEITRATLGEGHPDYATRLSNLAGLLLATGRLEEAERLFRQAVEITRATLGEGHPDYASSLNNLAALLQATGRMEEAERLFRQAVEITRATLGEGHPDYASSLNNLAALLKDTGRLEEAEPLYRQSLAILEATIPDHPNTATARKNLNSLLAEMGKA